MKNISTGTGLCVLGLCLASYPIIDRVMPRAEAGATHVAAVVAAATAQVPPEPTIVWYGTGNNSVLRAWSNGRVEGFYFDTLSSPSPACAFPNDVVLQNRTCGTWVVLADPANGLTYRSDIDFNSKVDGSDLAQVLNDWGNAPRQDIPPSTCPLNLINP